MSNEVNRSDVDNMSIKLVLSRIIDAIHQNVRVFYSAGKSVDGFEIGRYVILSNQDTTLTEKISKILPIRFCNKYTIGNKEQMFELSMGDCGEFILTIIDDKERVEFRTHVVVRTMAYLVEEGGYAVVVANKTFDDSGSWDISPLYYFMSGVNVGSPWALGFTSDKDGDQQSAARPLQNWTGNGSSIGSLHEGVRTEPQLNRSVVQPDTSNSQDMLRQKHTYHPGMRTTIEDYVKGVNGNRERVKNALIDCEKKNTEDNNVFQGGYRPGEVIGVSASQSKDKSLLNQTHNVEDSRSVKEIQRESHNELKGIREILEEGIKVDFDTALSGLKVFDIYVTSINMVIDAIYGIDVPSNVTEIKRDLITQWCLTNDFCVELVTALSGKE